MAKPKNTGGSIVILSSADQTLVAWGERMADFMEALGITQAGLAEELGVSHVSVWRWVNGKTEPTRHHKKMIAEVLQTTTSRLFAEVA